MDGFDKPTEESSKMKTITVKEAADRSGLSVAIVRRRINQGRVPGAEFCGEHPHGVWKIPDTKAAMAGLKIVPAGRPRKTGPTAAKKV